MSEPTEPDAAPETEPETELDAVPETELDAAPEKEPSTELDTEAPELDQAATAPESNPASKNNQLIAIIAAAVIVIIVGVVGAFAIFGSDDDAKPVSAEDQAKTAAITAFRAIDKFAHRDSSGCQELVDNLALTPDQTDFLSTCVDEVSKQTEDTSSVTLESVTPTQVTLDDAAGTGTVTLSVVTVKDGKSETQSVPVTVVKVEDRWKVKLN